MASVIGTFVNSENFLNSLSATATNDIYVINNVDLDTLADKANEQLSTIARTGNFGDLEVPPTKTEILDILEITDDNIIYTNSIDWDNVTNKPADLGGGGNEGGSVSIPTNISAFTNDVGYITSYTESDPVFSDSPAAGITSALITTWNNKSDFSGSYNDLTDKPTFPTDIYTYDFTESTSVYLSNLTNGVLGNIDNILFTSSGSESIETYLSNLITRFQTNKVIKVKTNLGQHEVTNIEHVNDTSNNINYYVINLTPILINNYYNILGEATNDAIYNGLETAVVYYILIVDVIYHRLVIKNTSLTTPIGT